MCSYHLLQSVPMKTGRTVRRVISNAPGKRPAAWVFERAFGSGVQFVQPPPIRDEDGDFVEPVPLYTSPVPPVEAFDLVYRFLAWVESRHVGQTGTRELDQLVEDARALRKRIQGAL